MNCCEASRRRQILDNDFNDLYRNKREQVRGLNKSANFSYQSEQQSFSNNDERTSNDDYVMIKGQQQYGPANGTIELAFSDTSACQQCNCEDFHVNDKTLEFKLKSVANCLAYLLQEPTNNKIEHGDAKYQANSSGASSGPVHQLGMIEQRNSFIRDRLKLKRIMHIHSILLRISPIEAQINDSSWIMNLMLKRSKSLNGARQQVLKLIENLNGYCDSIDLLRCIFRTNHIAQVMLAFDEIIKISYAQLRVQKKLTKNGLLNIVGDSIGNLAPRVEFRIVREWTI